MRKKRGIMDKKDCITIHDKYASTYDSQVKEYNSYVQEALFGMCYEYIKVGDTLLDLGIGTGLSSIYFAQAGLNVYGMDASAGMIEECRKKGFAKELKNHNITKIPLPYSATTFSHAISCGIFHFFGNLQLSIAEVSRLLKENGIFAFTIASLNRKNKDLISEHIPNFIEVQSHWGVPIFKHSDTYIYTMTKAKGLEVQKEQKLLVESGDKNSKDILFKIIVTQKKSK